MKDNRAGGRDVCVEGSKFQFCYLNVNICV